MMISFDLQLDSHRQRKMLERNPVLYLTKKMSGSEVQLTRLNEHDKQLFHRAKLKEVDSFLKNQAVRKALNDKELAEAYGANRIIKARWVLTWKPSLQMRRKMPRRSNRPIQAPQFPAMQVVKPKLELSSWDINIPPCWTDSSGQQPQFNR